MDATTLSAECIVAWIRNVAGTYHILNNKILRMTSNYVAGGYSKKNLINNLNNLFKKLFYVRKTRILIADHQK